MTLKPWVISVLSTDYDLHEYREAVINKLKDKAISVSAFELPDFPVEINKNSHENCLIALDRADIALLILDKRYGGIYAGDATSQQSITETEYLKMVEQGKPCFVFVSNHAWDERHVYKMQQKAWINSHTYTVKQVEGMVPKAEFDANYQCVYVENVKMIDFIEKIQKAYERFGVSNWIDKYDGIPDLLLRIEGKLKGHTRFLLEQLVNVQKKTIETRHTSTGFSLSLGDVFARGYFIEPSYSEESGQLLDGSSLDCKIRDSLLGTKSVLVYGEAGYGKTTILAKTYLSHVAAFLSTHSYKIPFYLWLKMKSRDYHFDFTKYISESFTEDWRREPYPYIDLKNIQPYFYFDGFDEIAEKMEPAEVEKISKGNMFSYPVLLTCRQQYAFRYISNFSFSDVFTIRLKIDTWNTEMSQAYIDNFCRIKGKDPQFILTVHQLLNNNQELCDILNNPLLLTMLLWIIEQNRMCIPETLRTRIALFDSCLIELAKRELARFGQSEALASEMVIVWSYAAWEVYLGKLRNEPIKLSQLISRLRSILPEITFAYSASHFEALFDSSNDEVFGTFHEQFLEFLVANTIYKACVSASYPYPDFLKYIMRPEINRYFRAIWRERDEVSKRVVVVNIYDQYLKNLGDDSFDAVSKRVHAIYHLGRFDSSNRQEILEKAFKYETHISVLLSLFFGAIKMGRLEDEEKFCERLETNIEYNKANRGYHMAYYSDTIMGNRFPFEDDAEKKWTGTLRAFMRHFQSNELEHYFLRRVDLVTMKQLIEVRNVVDPLDKNTIDKLAALISNSQYRKVYPGFQAKVENAFLELTELYNERTKAGRETQVAFDPPR